MAGGAIVSGPGGRSHEYKVSVWVRGDEKRGRFAGRKAALARRGRQLPSLRRTFL